MELNNITDYSPWKTAETSVWSADDDTSVWSTDDINAWSPADYTNAWIADDSNLWSTNDTNVWSLDDTNVLSTAETSETRPEGDTSELEPISTYRVPQLQNSDCYPWSTADTNVWSVADDTNVLSSTNDTSVWSITDDISVWSITDDTSVWSTADDATFWSTADDTTLLSITDTTTTDTWPEGNASKLELVPAVWDSQLIASLDGSKPINHILGPYGSLRLDKNFTEDFMTEKSCTFYLTMKKSSSPLDLKALAFIVAGPTGFHHPVSHTQLSDRIACSFTPIEAGLFAISVFLNETFHLQGSPAHVVVSRDYKNLNNAICVDIACWNLQSAEPPSTRKIRRMNGICFNTNTHEFLIADYDNHEILVYGVDMKFRFSFGGPGTDTGRFSRPSDIAYTPLRDRIFIADKDNHRVQIFNGKGQFQSAFGSLGHRRGQFRFPWAVAISPDGRLLAVADSMNQRIQLFDVSCKYVCLKRVTPLEFQKSLLCPRGITFDLNGNNLYVTDLRASAVFVMDIHFLTIFAIVPPGLLLRRPSGITVDRAGNFIVCDFNNNSLRIFKPSGQPLVALNYVGSKPFELPIDVTIMDSGIVAVLDFHGRVRFF